MNMRFLLFAPVLAALVLPARATSLLDVEELCDCCRAYEGACVPVCAKVVNYCRPESTRNLVNPLLEEDPWNGLEAVSFARTFGVFFLKRLERTRLRLEAYRDNLQENFEKGKIPLAEYRAGIKTYRSGLTKYNDGISLYRRNR